MSDSKKIGLFYGSSTCYTEMAAEKIRDYLGEEKVDLYNISETDLRLANDYSQLIFGIPTWNYGELQEDWENSWELLSLIDWPSRVVALYGLGDQADYPQWYQDALGYLWARVGQLGATTIGLWPVEGYQFTNSKALTSDGKYFVGLALNEGNDFESNSQSIDSWCQQISIEFKAHQADKM